VTIIPNSIYVSRDIAASQIGFSFMNTTQLGNTQFVLIYNIYGAMAAVNSQNQIKWNYLWVQSVTFTSTTIYLPDSWANNIAASEFTATPTSNIVSKTNNSITLQQYNLAPETNYDILVSVPVQNPTCSVGQTVNIGLVVGVTVGGVTLIAIIIIFFIILHLIMSWNKKRRMMILPLTATTVVATPASTVGTPAMQPNQSNIGEVVQTSQVNLLTI
jgi:hypothetical protein